MMIDLLALERPEYVAQMDRPEFHQAVRSLMHDYIRQYEQRCMDLFEEQLEHASDIRYGKGGCFEFGYYDFMRLHVCAYPESYRRGRLIRNRPLAGKTFIYTYDADGRVSSARFGRDTGYNEYIFKDNRIIYLYDKGWQTAVRFHVEEGKATICQGALFRSTADVDYALDLDYGSSPENERMRAEFVFKRGSNAQSGVHYELMSGVQAVMKEAFYVELDTFGRLTKAEQISQTLIRWC